MYLNYWRLKEKPFEASPDARFYWSSHAHEEALHRLLFSCHEHRGSMVLTGEYGCGKTLLSRVLIRELARDARCQIALILNPRLTAREFLKMILFELGGPKDTEMPDKVTLLTMIQQLLETNAKGERETTLIIDDAQAIEGEEILEEIRLLTNLQYNDQLLLNLIFIGQPELKDKISRLKQLSQRIQMWFHLSPLGSPEEVGDYIRHRLRVAGLEEEIFTPEACQKAFGLSGGVPRVINNVCNMALWIGEKTQSSKIDAGIIETAFQTLKG